MQIVWAISTLLALGVVAQSPATTATPTTASPTDVTISSTSPQESVVDGLTTDNDNRHPGGVDYGHPGGDDYGHPGGDDNRHHEYDSGDPRASHGLYASRTFVDGGDIGYAEGRLGYGPTGGHIGDHIGGPINGPKRRHDGGHNGYFGSSNGYGSHRNNRGYGN